MTVEDLTVTMKKYEKFFVDPSGEIFLVEELHEKTARQICQEKKWNWRNSRFYSAEDFLLNEGYIKFSNYSCLKYVAYSRKFSKDNLLINRASKLALIFNINLVEFLY